MHNPDDLTLYEISQDITDFYNEYVVNDSSLFELDVPFTMEELVSSIKKLGNNKAPGPDKIINELIKNVIPLRPVILGLFNNILDKGEFPDGWKVGIIVPLLKKGDPDDPNNYWGITLMSCLGKLFTRIMCARLDKWTDDNGVYMAGQSGFRAGHSTSDNLVIIRYINDQAKKNKSLVYSLFIDYRKAFDLINREALWVKLFKIGVKGKTLKLLHNMYSGIRAKVRNFNSETSEDINMLLGVMQGETLSPYLFSMYINDLDDYIREKCPESGVFVGNIRIVSLFYADDASLFASNPVILQQCIDALSDYCERWNLYLSVPKTKIVIFGGTDADKNVVFKYRGDDIEIVSAFKYLGIYLTDDRLWIRAQKELANQASKSMGMLKRYSHKYRFKTKFKLRLFDTLVSSILNYASELWGQNESKQIELVQNRFLRSLCWARDSTPLSILKNEYGQIPMKEQRKILLLKFWARKANHPRQTLCWTVMKEVKTNNQTGSWSRHLRETCRRMGFEATYDRNSAPSPYSIKRLSVDRVTQMAATVNDDIINRSEKCDRLYKYLNSNIRARKISKYHETVTSDNALILTRFISGNHRYKCETGYWRDTEFEGDFDCNECGVFESETHVIYECFRFDDYRERYITPFVDHDLSYEENFKNVIEGDSKRALYNLCHFIRKAQKQGNNGGT